MHEFIVCKCGLSLKVYLPRLAMLSLYNHQTKVYDLRGFRVCEYEFSLIEFMSTLVNEMTSSSQYEQFCDR